MIRIVASFALCVTGVVCAQSEPHQQFEVASIKASKDPTSSSSWPQYRQRTAHR